MLKLLQTETIDFAGIGRIQNIDRVARLVLTTVKSPAVAVVGVKIPDPAGVIARFLIELTREDKLVERAARRFAKCISHIR